MARLRSYSFYAGLRENRGPVSSRKVKTLQDDLERLAKDNEAAVKAEREKTQELLEKAKQHVAQEVAKSFI